jgi:hypothetical protein
MHGDRNKSHRVTAIAVVVDLVLDDAAGAGAQPGRSDDDDAGLLACDKRCWERAHQPGCFPSSRHGMTGISCEASGGMSQQTRTVRCNGVFI